LIIKTITHKEHLFLLSILPDYLAHVEKYENTLLCRIYGVHRVKQPGNKKIHFVVMENIFPPNKDIHEVYDLKGSLVGRSIMEEEVDENPRAVMKDLNWLDRGKIIQLDKAKKKLLLDQLKIDVDFLSRHEIMDYSILIGVHNVAKGNRENIRNNFLTLVRPSTDISRSNTRNTHRKATRSLTLSEVYRPPAQWPDDTSRK
jgi:1-phosphatidylinositol-4-phosphate 5-kinase